MSNKPKKSAVLPIAGVVILSFVLLSFASALNIESFRWALEVAVLVAAVAAVYYILRKNSEFCSEMVGDNLVIKQKMGNSERFVFAVEISNIHRLVPQNEVEVERSALGVKAMARYHAASAESTVWGLVYYDTTYKCEKILTFAPSEELLEVLSKKTIDNRG